MKSFLDKIFSSGDADVIVKPEVTIKLLAEKLENIEEEKGYGVALLGANTLNYLEVNALVELDSPVNDPNLMPTRFMILSQASDQVLDGNGNLDNFPLQLHENAPHTVSVENVISGLKYIQALPEEFECENQMTEEVFNTYVEYLSRLKCQNENATISDEAIEYTVVEGDTLSKISKEFNIPSWEVLYEINRDIIGENPDLIQIDTALQIPVAEHNPLREYLKLIDAEKFIGGMCYRYIYEYFSTSLCDDGNVEIAGDGEFPKEFAHYIASNPPAILNEFELNSYDEIFVMKLRHHSCKYGIKGEKYFYDNQIMRHPSDLAQGDGQGSSTEISAALDGMSGPSGL